MSQSRFTRARLAALIAVPLVIIGGALAYAHQNGGHGGHRGHGGSFSAEHLDHLSSMLEKIGASDAQASQIDGLLRPALNNLQAIRDAHHQAFGQFHELIMAPSLDRARIEALRAEQIKALDEASKNLVTAFGDAAEVLTPEQRAAFAEAMRKHHGG